MSSKSTKYRNKVKEERSEKYQQYLDKQKKNAAERRKKMREAMNNPTEEDKKKKEKQLEKQRARQKRYLERMKAAPKSATVSSVPSNLAVDTVGPVLPCTHDGAQQTLTTIIPGSITASNLTDGLPNNTVSPMLPNTRYGAQEPATTIVTGNIAASNLAEGLPDDTDGPMLPSTRYGPQQTLTTIVTGSSAASNLTDHLADDTVGPLLECTHDGVQQTLTIIVTERTSDYNACAEHPGEKVRVCCIDCDRKLLCVECLPRHRRHVLTRYRMLDHGEIIQQIDITLDKYSNNMMMIGSVFYFKTDYSITTYNMNTDTTEQIDTDGGDIHDMCVSPDNTSLWYCTGECEVYEYDVENRTCQLRFTCDSHTTWSICVTRSGDVVLGVQRCSDDSDSDDSDSDDSDSDDSDSGCDVKYKYYLEMYTQQDSYTTCTTSVCIKGKRGLKYGVIPYYIMACPVTGDLLVTESIGNTVLLTDDKCNTKFWFRGKTVTNKHGNRKRTGYNRRLCFGAACFDKEGNILILNGGDKSVIVIDHDTGMYIRTVHQEPDIRFMCIQDNGLLWCCVGSYPKYKLKSIKYIEKLE